MNFENLVPVVYGAGFGAIVGDTAGSTLEFRPVPPNFDLFGTYARPTDDSVMTLAVAEGLIDSWGQSLEAVYGAIRDAMQTYAIFFPHAGYGGKFRQWIRYPEPYNSFGNGSAMRASAAGWLFNTLDDVMKYAALTALPSHNHPEGVKGAQATAAAIFLTRCSVSKEDLAAWITQEFGYDLNLTVEGIRHSNRHDISCQHTVPESIFAFLQGNSFEEVIRIAISLTGDTDTLAAIAGSIAEACYPVPAAMQQETLSRMDPFLLDSYRNYANFVAANVAPKGYRQ